MYDEKLITENIKLIYLVLKDMKLLYKEDDYFDVGMIGLVQGAKTYDAEKGYAASTYLYQCIKHAIIKEMQKDIKKSDIKVISLDKEVDELHTLNDLIPDDINIENDYILKNEAIMISEAIKKLTPREQIIIKASFGLEEYQGYSLSFRKIGDILSTSKSNVYRIRKKAIKKLKKELESKL